MERRSDAVADELADHRKPLRLDIRLDRGADIRHSGAGPNRRHRAIERGLRHIEQSLRFRAHRADWHRHRGVAIKSVELRAHVDRDDISLDQGPRRWNAVHDLFIHRRANRRRVTVVTLERRLRTGLP